MGSDFVALTFAVHVRPSFFFFFFRRAGSWVVFLSGVVDRIPRQNYPKAETVKPKLTVSGSGFTS